MWSFDEISALYDACHASYAAYHEGTGCMHMPLFEASCQSRAECLLQTNSIILDDMEVERGDAVVDLGCGVGTLASQIAMKHGAFVVGIAATEQEVIEGAMRAREGRVSEHCRFVRCDMNAFVGTLGAGTVTAVTSLETDCYFHPYAQRVVDVHRMLRHAGLWHAIRFGVHDHARRDSVCQRLISAIERGWRTAPLLDRKYHQEVLRGRFRVEARLDLSDRVVSFWEKHVPVPLHARSEVMRRFVTRATQETPEGGALLPVLRHRLAFWHLVRGLARGWFYYEYCRLRKYERSLAEGR